MASYKKWNISCNVIVVDFKILFFLTKRDLKIFLLALIKTWKLKNPPMWGSKVEVTFLYLLMHMIFTASFNLHSDPLKLGTKLCVYLHAYILCVCVHKSIFSGREQQFLQGVHLLSPLSSINSAS